VNAPRQLVHVRVNDAATGQPTPVRIAFTNPAGEYFAPLGRLTEFGIEFNEDVGGNLQLGSKKYAYIDGTCEIELPPGQILVEIHKGPEYQPRFLEVMLKPGQLALRTAVERWIDMRRERWYSGDMRAHFLTPHAALLEAAAEDLAVVNLLITVDIKGMGEVLHSKNGRMYEILTNILAFSGQRPALEMPGHMVVVNTLNSHSSLGDLALLNCHRIIFPLQVEDGEEGFDRPLADWCDQCHRKGGLVVWANLFACGGEDEEPSFGERIADLMLGKIDAIEMAGECLSCPFVEEDWYTFLSAGCRVPLVGASEKACNADLLGGWRTYARLRPGEEFTYQNWIEAVRAGRVFLTNGPLLLFTVDGQDPGAVIDLPSLDQPVHIAAEVRSAVPVETLELIVNGQVYRKVEATSSSQSLSLTLDAKLPAAGWLAARCTGPLVYPETPSPQRYAAHTSPIYVQVGGRPPRPDQKHLEVLLAELDKVRSWAGAEDHTGNGRMQRRVVQILDSARTLVVERGLT
jgi:hypothetical protein